MSIFGSIMHKIFGSSPAAAATPAADAAAPAADGAAAAGAASAGPPVDVVAVLTGMASQNSQKLNWEASIVDLMKLLGLDSSLDARKMLADELGYTGDTNDFRDDERVAAQAGYGAARRKRRHRARQPTGLTAKESQGPVSGP